MLFRSYFLTERTGESGSMLTQDDLGTLVGGGDCLEHYHRSDRFPPRDSRLWQDSLESVVYVDSSYSITSTDDIVISTAAGGVTITLPEAVGGRRITITRIGAGIVTVTASGTDTVNGAASIALNTTYLPARLKAVVGGWMEL